MVKMIFCLRRRPEVTPEAFREHWRNVHAPLIAKHAAALGIKRYVQVYALDGPAAPGRPEPFDGIGEVWVESVEQYQAALATPEGVAAVKEIGERDAALVDVARSPRTFGTEVHVVG